MAATAAEAKKIEGSNKFRRRREIFLLPCARDTFYGHFNDLLNQINWQINLKFAARSGPSELGDAAKARAELTDKHQLSSESNSKQSKSCNYESKGWTKLGQELESHHGRIIMEE